MTIEPNDALHGDEHLDWCECPGECTCTPDSNELFFEDFMREILDE